MRVAGPVLTLALAFGAALLVSAGPSALSNRPPARSIGGLALLPPAARGPVSAALGRDQRQYQITGLRARNPTQGLDARFSARSVSVSFGDQSVAFTSLRFGRGRDLSRVSVTVPEVHANRVDYGHGRLSEYWANGPLGLEQEFVVRSRPRGRSGRLTVSLTIADRSSPRVLDGAVLLGGGLRYSGLVATDARGRLLPAWLALSAGRIMIEVDDRGARYPLRIDPIVQQTAELEISSPAAEDQAGYSVAISGSTIAVGVRDRSNFEGAVYVFSEPASGGWAAATQTAELTASDAVEGDELGSSVAISGDGGTIAAGAPGNDGSSATPGAVYVFVKPSSGNWTTTTQSAELTETSGAAKDLLGSSVAVSGDGSVVISGAWGVNHEAGVAYVFVRNGATWTPTAGPIAALSDPSPADGDELGYAVGISADGSTAVAGAPDRVVDGGEGSVYVFQEPGSGWTGTVAAPAELTPLGSGALNQGLGTSVAISGDGGTIVAGAPADTANGGVGEGEAWVFVKPGTGWVGATASAELTEAGDSSGDNFGTSVAASGDGSTIVVGAVRYATGNSGQGAAFAFVEPASGWSAAHAIIPTAELESSDGANDDNLGWSAAVSADGTTAVVGAPYADDFAGRAYVFATPTATTTTTTTTPTGVPPSSTEPPHISGTPLPGDTLTCSPGTWSGTPDTFAYQWYRGVNAIAGATQNRYTVQILDEAQTLHCTVTASNISGAGKPVSSPGVLVAVKGTLHCPKPTGKLTSKAVGPLSLGMSRAAARARLRRFVVTKNGFDNFCLYAGWGIRVAYPTAKLERSLTPNQRSQLAGRIILALTANPFYSRDGAKPGLTLSSVAKRLHVGRPSHIGSNYWYLATGKLSSLVLKVRAGVIQELGIANLPLTRTRKAQSTLLHGFPDI